MTDLILGHQLTEYKPKNNIRFVTAASLFDGHDASINIMRRILKATGVEVIQRIRQSIQPSFALRFHPQGLHRVAVDLAAFVLGDVLDEYHLLGHLCLGQVRRAV